jgi:RND family efflux transporter MFP subunit
LLLASSASAQPGKPAPGPPPALVVTAAVEAREVRGELTLVGNAMPRRTAAVASDVEGLVESVDARRGDRVERGQALARLRARRVELDLQESRAGLAEVETRLARARDDLTRAERLGQGDLVSAEELAARRAEVGSIAQQAERQRAAALRAEDRAGRTTVRAPFAGVVVGERTEVGQWVGVGGVVAELAELAHIDVVVPVPEAQLGRIARGVTVRVQLDALPGRTIAGRFHAVVPRGDEASRTFPVLVAVANDDGAILAGMSARVVFPVGEARSTLLVAKDAYVPAARGNGHVVRVKDGVAEVVPVTVLHGVDDRFAVAPAGGATLAAGDRVVVRGNERVRPGQSVREAGPETAGGPSVSP